MFMILGIGNHGNEYANTRHNCGFFVVDALAARWGQQWDTNKKWKADIIRCRPDVPMRTSDDSSANQVLLVRPRTYVNLSGAAMQAAATFFKIPPANILVVVDDIHLKLGDLRYRANGGAGGHNGLRDIETRFGKQYPRLRMGIGAPAAAGHEQTQHVLGKFSSDEAADRDAMTSKACDACLAWLAQGDDGAALRYNGPLRPPAPKSKASPNPPAPQESPTPQASPANQQTTFTTNPHVQKQQPE
jgi:PTH1 family peptidyl-tRNA hydrolase